MDVRHCHSPQEGTETQFLHSDAFTSQECTGKLFFFNIQLYKVHLKCMNYLSQVGVLAILSLVIKPTVQNKSFHSNSTFQICRLPQATIYNQFPARVTYAMYGKWQLFKWQWSEAYWIRLSHFYIGFCDFFFKEMKNWWKYFKNFDKLRHLCSSILQPISHAEEWLIYQTVYS